MEIGFESFYSKRARGMKASEIRELLKLTQNKEIISFAGGLPNPGAFPAKVAAELTKEVFENHAEDALQYGTTEGLPTLREAFAENYSAHKLECSPDQILITSGSQQGLDLLSKVFLNPGDTIIVGAPTYLGALGSFRAFQANIESVPLDEKGFRVDALEEKLEALKHEGKRVKFIYLVPTFQNPTGVTIPEDRRKRILAMAEEYDTLVVEDDPYGRLRFEGDGVPSLFSLDRGVGRVIHMGTLSKLLAPGLRVATLMGHPDMIKKFVIAKQSTDLCSNTLTQFISAEYIRRGHLDEHVKFIRDLYGKKKNIMLQAMDDFMPSGVEWTRPEGGMFIWATVPEGLNTVDLFSKAIERKVAYVVGRAFYVSDGGEREMRLNFSYASDESIREGIERLGKVIEEAL